MCKSSYVEKLFNLANRGNFLITLILFIVIAILIAIFLQFSENAYYFTLSSIFQGLFSILALAGIFVVFRIEQLSKDEAKYETDIKDYLRKIRMETIQESPGLFQGLYKKEIMEWNEFDAILKLLDERKIEDYINELEKFKIKLKHENEILEEKISEIKGENEKKGSKIFSKCNGRYFSGTA